MQEALQLNKTGVKYFTEGNYGQAIGAFQAAIDLRPDYVDAYYNLGLTFTKAGRRVDALAAYDALIELDPLHLGAHFQAGLILMQREKFDEAILHFSLLEREYPTHVESLVNLAGCLLRKQKWLDARAKYEKVLLIDSHEIQALYNLGVLSAAYGRHLEAIDFYRRALKEDHTLFAAHNNLAVLYLELRDADNALLHFRAALHLQSSNEAIMHSIRLLAKEEVISSSPIDYVRALFDSYADHYDMHLLQGLAYGVPQALLTLVEAYVPRGASLKILDLGCGTGLCGELLKPLAKKLVGVDLSSKMLHEASLKKIYDELIEADILSYLQKDESYDLVVAGDVFVYFGELNEVLTLIYKSLKPGGLLVFNAEISEDSVFSVTPSGRFQHHKAYIDKLIQETHFEKVTYRTGIMRRQYEQDVMGHLYLLRHP